MSRYNQASGEMQDGNGATLGNGYSGRGTDRNITASEGIRNRGPVPRGRYRMQEDHNVVGRGPVVIRLVPEAGTNTFGRDGFLIHGDNATNDASEGCIILDRNARNALINNIRNGANILTVE